MCLAEHVHPKLSFDSMLHIKVGEAEPNPASPGPEALETTKAQKSQRGEVSFEYSAALRLEEIFLAATRACRPGWNTPHLRCSVGDRYLVNEFEICCTVFSVSSTRFWCALSDGLFFTASP